MKEKLKTIVPVLGINTSWFSFMAFMFGINSLMGIQYYANTYTLFSVFAISHVIGCLTCSWFLGWPKGAAIVTYTLSFIIGGFYMLIIPVRLLFTDGEISKLIFLSIALGSSASLFGWYCYKKVLKREASNENP